MAHIGTNVEYALHCLLWLAAPTARRASSRDLAELQGVPAPFLAKILPKLQKAQIVSATEGVRGGYRLGRPAAQISILDVVDAIDGRKPLFECREIRAKCALFGNKAPTWATRGVCGIHAAILRAERSMRDELERITLASLSTGVNLKTPVEFSIDAERWLAERIHSRAPKKKKAARAGRRSIKS